jgi:hypothetical protein
LEVAYKDTAEAERAFQKIQQLTQKEDLESYIRESNTLRGLAQEAATLNETVILRYFIQGLAKDFRIAIATTAPRDLAARMQAEGSWQATQGAHTTWHQHWQVFLL